MKILIAHCRYRQRGGEDSVAEAEAELLRSRGHAVQWLLRDNREIDESGRARLAAQTLWSPRTMRDLERAVRTFRPDVVHVHNTFPLLSPSLYWAAARAGVPVVQTLHNFRLSCVQAMLLRQGRVCEDCVGHVPWRGVLRRCYHDSAAQSAVLAGSLALHGALGTYRSKVTRYIALNRFCRDKFVAAGLPEERIVIKPNFVDIPHQPEGERSGGLFVGRLSAEKGIEVLLGALDGMPRYRLDVIGTGPEQARLEQHATVHALGWQEQESIHARMRRATYLVLPSIWYENFPRTLVEAFACGLPVIASRLGAMAELIEDGRTGLLFDPGSPAALAQKIEWAESHPWQMRQMGFNAREEYERHYTPELNYGRLMEIYGEAIDAGAHEQAA